MKPIKVAKPGKLPDRPLLCYFGEEPKDAALAYARRYGRIAKAVYFVEFPQGRTDSFIPYEE